MHLIALDGIVKFSKNICLTYTHKYMHTYIHTHIQMHTCTDMHSSTHLSTQSYSYTRVHVQVDHSRVHKLWLARCLHVDVAGASAGGGLIAAASRNVTFNGRGRLPEHQRPAAAAPAPPATSGGFLSGFGVKLGFNSRR